MQRSLRPSALIPNGLRVESAILEGAAAVITVRAQAETSACPSCGEQARRVHSRYKRKLLDLPLGGRPVRLVVSARRFRCDVSSCARRIFAERFGGGALEPGLGELPGSMILYITSGSPWAVVQRPALRDG